MRRIRCLVGLALFFTSFLYPCNPRLPRTFFRPRSITQDSTFELALNNYQLYHGARHDRDICVFSLYVEPFYQKSTNGSELARYFFPCDTCSLHWAQDGSGNIGSLWFDLAGRDGTNFSSCLSMNPERTTWGGILDFHFDFHPHIPGLWFSLHFAAMHAEHNLHLCEQNIQNAPEDGIINAIHALNSPALMAGRFCPCALSEAGVDDVQLKLGYNEYFTVKGHAGFYLVGIIPTGERSNAHYIFEPIVGSRFGGTGVGGNFDFCFFENYCHNLYWMLDLKYIHQFSAKECRSFDLCKNGPWSRYLQVVNNNERSCPISGINIFTQFAKIRGGNTINFWTALHYAYNSCNIEVGYNLWWRKRERICQLQNLDPQLGIFDLSGEPTMKTSSSCARICQSNMGPNSAPSDPEFVFLSNQDMYLNSAAHPTCLSHKGYLGLSYQTFGGDFPILLGIIGSYEKAQYGTALDQWAVWATVGIGL